VTFRACFDLFFRDEPTELFGVFRKLSKGGIMLNDVMPQKPQTFSGKKFLIKFFLFVVLTFSWNISGVKVAQAYIGLCCAHCGGNMPLNVFGGGIPETHEFRFKVSQMFMEMGPLRDGTTDLNLGSVLGPANGTTFPAVPRKMLMSMTMFGGAYSFTDDFALMAMTSVKANWMEMEFISPLAALAGGRTGFTMKSGGLADTRLIGKYRIFKNDNLAPTQQVSLLFGASIPTGNIDEVFSNSPVPGQNGQLLPFKMQLGSGTVDPIFGVAYQGASDPLWYGANLWWINRFYDNANGYHQGDEVHLDMYTMYQFHENFVAEFQLNGFWEGRYSEEPDIGKAGQGHFGNNPANNFVSPLFDPNNYGGTKLNVTAGLQWQPFPLNIIEINGSVPVYQNLNGPQLGEEYRFMLSWYIEIPTSKSRRYTGTKPPKELGF